MKKLSMLIALALCVVVGGVYAAWTYATTGVQEVSKGLGLALTATADGGVKGTIEVAPSEDFKIEIDDTDNNHIGEVVGTGSITITFKPSATAEDDVKSNGIAMKYTLALSAPISANTNDTITVDGAEQKIAKCLTKTIQASEIVALITANVTLPTLAEYNGLAEVLVGKTINMVVNEDTAV